MAAGRISAFADLRRLELLQLPAGTRDHILRAGGEFLAVIGHLAVLDLDRAGFQFAHVLALVGGQSETFLQIDIDIDRKFGRWFYRIAAAAEVCRATGRPSTVTPGL